MRRGLFLTVAFPKPVSGGCWDVWYVVGVGRRAGGKDLPVSGGVWVVRMSGEVWTARRLGWEMRGLYIKTKARRF